MASGDPVPPDVSSGPPHKERLQKLGLSNLTRSFALFLILSILGSGSVLIGFLWVSLLIIENKILDQAQSQDFPVMVDSLTRPLDLTLDHVLQDALHVVREGVLEEWAKTAFAKPSESGQNTLSAVGPVLQGTEFEQMYVGSPDSTAFWFYRDGVMVRIFELPANEQQYRWFMDGLSQTEPYRFTFLPTLSGGDLWVSVLLGKADGSRGILYLSMSSKRLFYELGETSRRHHDSYYIAPAGHSLIENESLRMWIVDHKGSVVLSDIYDDIGRSIYGLFPSDMIAGFEDYAVRTGRAFHSHTVNWDNQISEMIHYPTMLGDMEMVVTIPHDRVVGFLGDIRWYLVLVCFVAGLVLTVGLAIVYIYVVNPNRRLVQLNHDLEVVVQEETNTLEKLARVDGLTGLSNRRYFDAVFASRCLNADARHEPLSILFVDVDFFKKYNDLYGHRAGDECLRRVADILKECGHRSHDLVARYGGEEFVVLLPDTPPSGAKIIAERARAAVEAAAIPHAGSAAATVVTISVGVAAMTPGFPVTMEALLEQADAALYKAKETGRNRTCVAGLRVSP